MMEGLEHQAKELRFFIMLTLVNHDSIFNRKL